LGEISGSKKEGKKDEKRTKKKINLGFRYLTKPREVL
jgi:hypothetical protein